MGPARCLSCVMHTRAHRLITHRAASTERRFNLFLVFGYWVEWVINKNMFSIWNIFGRKSQQSPLTAVRCLCVRSTRFVRNFNGNDFAEKKMSRNQRRVAFRDSLLCSLFPTHYFLFITNIFANDDGDECEMKWATTLFYLQNFSAQKYNFAISCGRCEQKQNETDDDAEQWHCNMECKERKIIVSKSKIANGSDLYLLPFCVDCG